MTFIGRQYEVAALRDEFAKAKPSLVIVYGRRRIGKSTLLQHASARAAATIYFQAMKLEEGQNLAFLKAEIARVLGADATLESLSDWNGVLYWLANAARAHAGLVVILDEFPYLADKRDALPSIIQKFWDSGVMAQGNLKLVLCGSLVSYMEDLLTERNPLFGRRTLSMELGAMHLREAAQFFPAYSSEDKIIAYSILGGVPHYLQSFDAQKSLRDNIIATVMAPAGALFDEPEFLLQSELREPRRYTSILAAVSNGANKLSEIVGRVGLKDTSQVTPYIDQLSRLGLIERQTPFGAAQRERDARYAVIDPLTRFWHRFIGPNLSALSRNFAADVYERDVVPQIPEYMGLAFEDIAREHLRRHAKERLSVPAQEIGKVWTADYDLDVIGRLLDRAWVFGECKWRRQQMGVEVLEKLRRRSEAAIWKDDQKARRFTLFSRSGYDEALRKRAAVDAEIVLFELDELVSPRSGYDHKTTIEQPVLDRTI